MSKKPFEYRYTSTSNPSGDVGIDLQKTILKRVRTMKGVRTICELGCGNGYLAKALDSLGYEITAIDSSESGIRCAKYHYEGKVNFIQSEIGDALITELGNEKFDLVLSSEVIEHLYVPRDLIEIAWKILKPNGTLLITTPYHGYIKNLAIALLNRFDSHVNPLWNGGHIKFFSPKTLSQLIEQSPFIIQSIDFWGRFPGLWKGMIVLAKKQNNS